MNEKFAQYRDRTFQYWQQFSKKQKIMLAATVGGLILVIILLTYMFSRTEYELAFQNLDATDAAAIIQHLNETGVSYQLGPDGTSIAVPAAVATEVKLDVGSQGMIRNGSIGFESFNEGVSQFGMTDNEFGVRYRNALNGEVQQLLNDMEGVRRSNVLINLPEESVFANSERELASASITMEFMPGFRPTQEQIDGYYNLVKTAVPNLTVDNITISSQEAELVASDKLSGGSRFASSAAAIAACLRLLISTTAAMTPTASAAAPMPIAQPIGKPPAAAPAAPSANGCEINDTLRDTRVSSDKSWPDSANCVRTSVVK